MRRPKRRLDMLPLLDVFMVVLFVFATIQESQIEESATVSQSLARELDEAEAHLEGLRREAASLRQELSSAAADQRQHRLMRAEVALAQEESRSQRLQDELTQSRHLVSQALDERDVARAQAEQVMSKLRAVKIQNFGSADQAKQAEVLERLLDQHSVFEIEVRGIMDEEEGVINLCCYRDNPLAEHWSSCGRIPARPEARRMWFQDGAAGLLNALRRTKGGNALTIIRHDAKTSHQIGMHMEEAIRSLVPEQRVYNEGISPLDIACPD